MSGRIPNEHGFTLIEMLIVILIISILLLIAVPNTAKINEVVKDKSCDATVKLIQSQVAAYEVEFSKLPTNLEALKTEVYIEDEAWICPDNQILEYDPVTGKVSRPDADQTL
ncbi:competence type IV pilus major pilin ComGC [Pseudalkalibacillus sp. A8]|uniref:competence type IV pilus major pilin ComGC n=1 Tax=Pseudalkalibacillus sp. A8 TaxID=3382641 RepID=UPI0038B689BA